MRNHCDIVSGLNFISKLCSNLLLTLLFFCALVRCFAWQDDDKEAAAITAGKLKEVTAEEMDGLMAADAAKGGKQNKSGTDEDALFE